MIPLTVGFLFMLTAWTYYLRGWLVTLMRNPRRYRAVVAGTTMALVLLSQLPNLLMNIGFLRESPSLSEMRRAQSEPAADGAAERAERHAISPTVLLWHKLAPPLWVGHGAMSLAMGNPLPAILATTATFGIGGLGLAFAYRSTCRFYGGRTTEKKIREGRKKRTRTAAGATLLERKLPGLSEEAAAMAFASCRSLTRASEVKMILASDVMMLFVFGGTILFSNSHERSLSTQFFYGTGIALLPFLGLIQLMTNQFGFDRAGFRTLVLSPTPRSQILLGKNLAILPIGMLLGVIYLALAGLGPAHSRDRASRCSCAIGRCILPGLHHGQPDLVAPAVIAFAREPWRRRRSTPTKVLLNLLSHLICMAVLSLLLLPAVLASLWLPRSGLTARTGEPVSSPSWSWLSS